MDSGPLSYSEERFWRGEQLPAETTTFVECPRHVPLFLRMSSMPDMSALRASLAQVLERHPVLRSRYVERDGIPIRLLGPCEEIPIPFTDLSVGVKSRPGRRAALGETLAAEVNRSFDLAAGQLLRARMIKVTDDRYVFAVVVHHIVFDGWSKHRMADEIGRLYAAGGDAPSACLPMLTADYGNYVSFQREWVQSEGGHEALAFWSTKLAAMPTLRVSGDRHPTGGSSTRSGVHRFAIPSHSTSLLRAVARASGATPGVTMAALFKVMLHKLTGAEDVAIGMPFADRNRPEFAAAIGLFLNLIVLRTPLDGNPTFLDVLHRVRRTLVDASRYGSAPYSLVRTNAANGSLVRIVFNFILARRPSSASLPIEEVDVDIDTPSCADFSLHIMDRSGALIGTVLYRLERFSPDYVRRMCTYFQSLILEILEHPERRIGDCAIITSTRCND
jgi:condensation domain-containing protein